MLLVGSATVVDAKTKKGKTKTKNCNNNKKN